MSKRLTTEQRLTPAKIEAIRKRAEAASGGPWELEDDGNGIWNREGYNYLGGVGLDAEDAIFIVEARTDIPALLAEVERLRVGISDVMDYSNGYEYYGELRELLGGGDSE